VAIDGEHTVNSVSEQMKFLRTIREPRAHAQLIGGEGSLLPAQDHALALLVMRSQGRESMSMSHGDFEYDYLLKVFLMGTEMRDLRKFHSRDTLTRSCVAVEEWSDHKMKQN
jgi:hypothetical protein